MLKVKIDTKTIFILVLATALILTIIFRPTKPIETYENEINMLKEQNKELLCYQMIVLYPLIYN